MAINRDIKRGSDLYEGDILYGNYLTFVTKFKVVRVGRKWVTVRYGRIDFKFSVDEAYPFLLRPDTGTSFRLFKSREDFDNSVNNQRLSDAVKSLFRSFTFRLPDGVTVSDALTAMELLGLRDKLQKELDQRGVNQ